MLIPSETVMVPKMTDLPPAASAPAPASRASWSMCMLHGVTMLHVEAMPTTGLAKSWSVKPTARSMERLKARSGPSVTIASDRRAIFDRGLATGVGDTTFHSIQHYPVGKNGQVKDSESAIQHIDLFLSLGEVRDGGIIADAQPLGYFDQGDRKSTRLNSSHLVISYAVFCL